MKGERREQIPLPFSLVPIDKHTTPNPTCAILIHAASKKSRQETEREIDRESRVERCEREKEEEIEQEGERERKIETWGMERWIELQVGKSL